MPYEEEKKVAGRIVAIAILFVVLTGLALAWRYTPLQQWANLESLIGVVERLEQGPLTPLAVMLAYVIGGFLVLPVTLMAAVTGAVFGPLVGALYAISGATLSAFVSYTIGRKLGRDALRRLAGKRLNELSMRFARRGLVAMIFVRIVPIAPFTIVNIVAGASHIRLLDFILGTIVGLAPGTTLIVVFVDRIVAAIRSPGVMTFAFLVIVVAVVVGLMLALRQRIAREHSEQET